MKPNQFPIRNNRIIFFSVTFLAICLTTLIGSLGAPPVLAVPSTQEMELGSLFDKANEFGAVRVIIGLDVAFTPEGELAGLQAVNAQQQAIAAAQAQVWQQISGHNASLIANFKYIPYMAVSVDAAALGKLSSLPAVTSIQEDKLSAPTLASSIPVIGADTAWAGGNTGSGQTIAVLDTGVDKAHDFFTGGKVVSEACYSTNYSQTIPGQTFTSYTVCPGLGESSQAVGSGVDCTAVVNNYPGSHPDAVEGCKHGTHVAGIAAGNDGVGPDIGVAKDANIIAIQVFSLIEGSDLCGTPDCVLTWDSDQISGLERVLALAGTYNIAAVNMSLGGDRFFSESFCDSQNAARKTAIDNLRSAGIATIIASGNNGYRDSMSAPACISTAISVGATEDNDAVAAFSNVASFLDLYAPGNNITSSVPGNNTATWGGTSMATPHVAGAWAIMREAAPTATVDDILAAFTSTGTLVDDDRIGGTVQNIPRINVDLAVNSLNQPPVATDDGAATPLDTAVTIDVIANDSDPNNDTLTISNVGAASHGTAVKASSTTIQFTPTTGYSGADSFTYTVSDGKGGTDNGTVIVIIDGFAVYLPAVLKN